MSLILDRIFCRNRHASFQRGSAMIEFVVAGPILTLIGTLILQYVLMFNAKNLVNHAGFMAARAGSMGNARISTIEQAYARALIPLYGGGRNASELAESLGKAHADLPGNSRVELLNPTRESFDDWADQELSDQEYGGRRAIPNSGLAFRDPDEIRPNSGQNVQDANLIKLKITHGYELKVPLAGTLIQFVSKWTDSGKDSFITELYAKRRTPLVTHITLQMQSDPVEPDNPVSFAGLGNDGSPMDPGLDEEPTRDLPICVTAGCTVIVDPNASGGGSGGGGNTPPPLLGCEPGDINCEPLPGPFCEVT